ncbi:MAG: hypothetical protein ABL921_10545 [Pirellula sp.]
MTLEPIKPKTHVLIVEDREVSGSTVGYHGTVIRVIDRSVLANPELPNRWSYRVYVPVLDAEFEIAARIIIPTVQEDDLENRKQTPFNIQFDSSPSSSSPSTKEIHGAFRVEDDWIHFHFIKHDESYDAYKLDIQVVTKLHLTRRLVFRVGRDTILDRNFVRQAIFAILWQDKTMFTRDSEKSICISQGQHR